MRRPLRQASAIMARLRTPVGARFEHTLISDSISPEESRSASRRFEGRSATLVTERIRSVTISRP